MFVKLQVHSLKPSITSENLALYSMQVFCYLQYQNSKVHQFSTWLKKSSNLLMFPITNWKSFLPLDYMRASFHCYPLWLTRNICSSIYSYLYNQYWTVSLVYTVTLGTTECHAHLGFWGELYAIEHLRKPTWRSYVVKDCITTYYCLES